MQWFSDQSLTSLNYLCFFDGLLSRNLHNITHQGWIDDNFSDVAAYSKRQAKKKRYFDKIIKFGLLICFDGLIDNDVFHETQLK